MQRSVAKSAGFTLVELLVVIGIISVLIAILMPALTKARMQSQKIKCMSNEANIGQFMLIYANDNRGYLFPPNLGWNGSWPSGDVPPASAQIPGTSPPQYPVWPYYVMKNWDPPIMICPSDPSPGGSHSYLANAHILPASMDDQTATDPNATRDLQYSTPLPNHVSPSQVIVLGEKLSSVYDYYMDPPSSPGAPGDFVSKVEQFRHGLVGSNYLFMDMHVETQVPTNAQGMLDPWDVGSN